METEITKEKIYELSVQSYGVVPGVIKEMAERSTALAHVYLSGTQAMDISSLTQLEINAIELKISLLNNCHSCVKGHSFLAKKAGLSDSDIAAIVNKGATSIERLNTLIEAAENIYYAGDDVYPDVVLDSFEETELTEQVIFEIIGLIALKTISNYVNNYLASVKQRSGRSIQITG